MNKLTYEILAEVSRRLDVSVDKLKSMLDQSASLQEAFLKVYQDNKSS